MVYYMSLVSKLQLWIPFIQDMFKHSGFDHCVVQPIVPMSLHTHNQMVLCEIDPAIPRS